MLKDTKITSETIYDPEIQEEFENWVIDSGIKIRFNTATYFIEDVLEYTANPILKLIGINKKKITRILHVVTNRPGFLIGECGKIINKYTEILARLGIDEIKLHEIRCQDSLLRGIKRKIKN